MVTLATTNTLDFTENGKSRDVAWVNAVREVVSNTSDIVTSQDSAIHPADQ